MRTLRTLAVCFTLLWNSAVYVQSADHDLDTARVRQSLAEALANDQVRTDLLMILVDSEDPSARVAAVEALITWHDQIPTTLGLLRRLAEDPNRDVRLSAVLAGLQIGTDSSITAIATAIDQPWDNAAAARIVDAVDTPQHRRWWKQRDDHQLLQAIERLASTAKRTHRVEELLRLPIPEPTAAVIDSGREAFIRARCDVCHRVAGYGRAVGPDLKNIGSCFDNQQLIQHIVDPSLDIHDVGRGEQILLDDGRLLTGQIISEAEDHLMVRLDAMKVDSSHRIERDEIVQRRLSPVSPMPTGLLDALTPTQVADLVSFLRSNGGQMVQLPHPHHH